MKRVNIKPLSVNRAWRGRRFKTSDYKKYERDLLVVLPMGKICEPPYFIKYKVGYSSKLADLSNMIKCFEDILCKKYNFDDRDVYKIYMEKEIVKKGHEFIEFSIEKYK